MWVGQGNYGGCYGHAELLEELRIILLPDFSKNKLFLVRFGQTLKQRAREFLVGEHQNFVFVRVVLYEAVVIFCGYNVNKTLHFLRCEGCDILPFHFTLELCSIVIGVLCEDLDLVAGSAVVHGELFAELFVFFTIDSTNRHDSVHFFRNFCELILKFVSLLTTTLIKQNDPHFFPPIELRYGAQIQLEDVSIKE